MKRQYVFKNDFENDTMKVKMKKETDGIDGYRDVHMYTMP